MHEKNEREDHLKHFRCKVGTEKDPESCGITLRYCQPYCLITIVYSLYKQLRNRMHTNTITTMKNLLANNIASRTSSVPLASLDDLGTSMDCLMKIYCGEGHVRMFTHAKL